MTQFVQRGAVPVNWLEIGFWPRHLHGVERGRVEGAVAADPHVGATCADQRLEVRHDQPLGHGRRRGGQVVRQAVALIDGKDREPLQERDRLGVLARLTGPALLPVGHEAVGVDDRRSAFALTDVAAETEVG